MFNSRNRDLRLLSEMDVLRRYPHVIFLKGLTTFLDGTGRGPAGWIGADAVIGLFGDTISMVLSLGLVGAAIYHRVPGRILRKMVGNIAFDYAVGLVPIVGDYYDFILKPNRLNYALLLKHLQEEGQRPAGRISPKPEGPP